MKTKCLTVALVALCLGFCMGRRALKPAQAETIYRTDTVVISRPELMVVRQTATDTVLLPVIRSDTILVRDSVFVELPRQQAEYSGDGYRAWVSGYRPRLDSLRLEREVAVTTRRRSRWSVGVHAGMGMTPRGLQPYIGVGVSYRLY